MWDAIDDAIYHTVHGFQDRSARGAKGSRGAEGLAPRVNMNAGTLSNKANPGMEGHQLTLKESIPIQLTTNDYRIVQAYCHALGGVFMPIENLDGTSDMELLNTWAKLVQEEGETAAAIREALQDSKITRDELQIIRRETFEDITVKLELLNRLEAIADE